MPGTTCTTEVHLPGPSVCFGFMLINLGPTGIKRMIKKILAGIIVGEPTLKKSFIKGDNWKVAGPIQTMLRFHP